MVCLRRDFPDSSSESAKTKRKKKPHRHGRKRSQEGDQALIGEKGSEEDMTQNELSCLGKENGLQRITTLIPRCFARWLKPRAAGTHGRLATSQDLRRRYIDPIESIERFGAHLLCATEREHRSTSFGLCQVMGQVAREMGCIRCLPLLSFATPRNRLAVRRQAAEEGHGPQERRCSRSVARL